MQEASKKMFAGWARPKGSTSGSGAAGTSGCSAAGCSSSCCQPTSGAEAQHAMSDGCACDREKREAALHTAEEERSAAAEGATEAAKVAAVAAQAATEMEQMKAAAEAAISGATEFMLPPQGHAP